MSRTPSERDGGLEHLSSIAESKRWDVGDADVGFDLPFLKEFRRKVGRGRECCQRCGTSFGIVQLVVHPSDVMKRLSWCLLLWAIQCTHTSSQVYESLILSTQTRGLSNQPLIPTADLIP